MVRLATMEFQDMTSVTGIPSNNVRSRKVPGGEQRGKERVARDEEGMGGVETEIEVGEEANAKEMDVEVEEGLEDGGDREKAGEVRQGGRAEGGEVERDGAS